jgi:hypothetical protein
MLDLLDFQTDKGGDLKKLKESQRRRYTPEALIDDIVATFEDHKRSKWPWRCPTASLMLTGYSQIRRLPEGLAGQCHPEGDRTEEEGEGGCHGANGEEDVPGEGEEAAGGLCHRKGEAVGGQAEAGRQLRPRLRPHQRR